MALKKFKNNTNTLIFVGVTLCVIQGVYMYISSQNAPDIKTSIQSAIKKVSGADGRRKEQLKIQLALNLFKAKTGAYPKTLEMLTPDFVESVPNDPATGKKFSYTVEHNSAFVGVDGDMVLTQQQLGGAADDSTQVLADAVATQEMLAFVYNPAEKRDPFKPYEYTPQENDTNKTPLEQYDYNEIRLSAVLLDVGEQPKAMLEDSTGKGYTARIGTKIGPRGGQIISILKDKLVILETIEDADGSIKAKEVEILLRGTADAKESDKKTIQNGRAKKTKNPTAQTNKPTR
jgi:Tfp pilus assembly protein PilP